jgi:hypothetical protein
MGTRAEEIATGGGKTVGEIGRLDSRETCLLSLGF